MVHAGCGKKRLNLLNRDVMNTIGVKQNLVDGDDIDIAALISHLMANKWLIVAVILITLSCGYFYAHRQIPQYQADVLLQVDTSKAGSMHGGLADQLSFGGAVSGNPVATQIALIQSRFVLEPVIQELGLDIRIIPKRSFWQKIWNKKANQMLKVQTFDVPHNHLNTSYQLYLDSPLHVKLYNKNRKYR